MKKKLVIAVPIVLLLVGGFAAKTMLMKPKPAPPPKVAGTLVTLAPEFLINLSGGHYGKVTVALEMSEPPAPPVADGVKLPQDAAVRARVTDAITGLTSEDLISRKRRHTLQQEILRSIKRTTDEPVTDVLFTDIAVQ